VKRYFSRPSLHRRLALILVVQTVAVLLLTALALFLVLRSFLKESEERRLETLVERVSVHVPDEKHEALALKSDFPSDVHVRLLQQGEVVAATPDFPNVPLDAPTGYSIVGLHQVLSREVREDGQRFVLQLAGDAGGVRVALRAYLSALAVIVPLAALVVAALSNLVAGNMLAPVRQLERAAAGLSGSRELRTPLPGVAAGDELGRLARTLQATFTRLADGMDREVDFLRAAAHDLRSPLTALRTRIEGALARPRAPDAYRATLVELQQDVENMRSLVDHLLLLAQDHAPTKLVEVDLPALANAAVDAAREARPGALLTADLAPDTPPVRGDPLLLTQLLTNLLENAAYHGGGAPTELACWRGPGGGAVLRVSDSGPGVAAAEVARLGEPFYRPDPARGRAAPSGHQGSGLGLAIVKRVVEWHGAAWRIESAPGEGFSVTVEFLPA